jgi:hypothetical protein
MGEHASGGRKQPRGDKQAHRTKVCVRSSRLFENVDALIIDFPCHLEVIELHGKSGEAFLHALVGIEGRGST